MAGWDDVKWMLLILLVFQFVSFVFSTQVDELAVLTPTTSNVLGKLFNPTQYASGTTYTEDPSLQGSIGNEIGTWTERNDTTLNEDNVRDFQSSTWNWIKGFTVGLVDFFFSPINLVSGLLSIDSIEFLWWLPPMFYIVWSLLYAISVISIFKK